VESSGRRSHLTAWRRRLPRGAARTRRAVAERIGACGPPPREGRRAWYVPAIACRMRRETRAPDDCASYPRAGRDLHRSKCVHGGEVVRAGPRPRHKGHMTTARPRAFDWWGTPPGGSRDSRPESLVRGARDYLKREREILGPAPPPGLRGQMEGGGVGGAVIPIDGKNPEP